MKQRYWSVVLCVLCMVILAACGDGSTAGAEQNLYLEEQVTLPEGADIVKDVVHLDDGGLGIICFNKKQTEGSVWRSDDKGKTWGKEFVFTKKLPMKNLNLPDSQCETSLSPSGEVFLSVTQWQEEKESKYNYFIAGQGNRVQELNIKAAVFKCDFADDRSLLIQTAENSHIQKLDKQSGSVLIDYSANLDQEMIPNAFTARDDLLYILTNEKVFGFALDTGEEVKAGEEIQKAAGKIDNSENFEPDNNQRFLVAADEKGKTQVYNMDKYGINRYSGSDSTLLIDGKETCIYTSRNQLYAFEKLSEDHFLAAADCDGTEALYSYTYNPDKNKEKQELVLYSLEENRDFNNAIARYQRSHPSVRLTVKTGIQKEQGITRSDALKTLNADILAGNGPDLICLNEIPVGNFIENGLLADVAEELKAINEKEGLLMNVAASYQKDGAIYAVPTQFALMSIQGAPEAVKAGRTLEGFVETAAGLSKKGPSLSGFNFNQYVMLLYRAHLMPEVQEQGRLEEASLKGFYQQIHKLFALFDPKTLADQEETLVETALSPYGYPGPISIFRENLAMELGYLLEPGNFQELLAMKKQKQMDYSLLGAQGKKLFIPQHIIGVNAKSEKKEAAKEFVSYLLTKDAQSCYYLQGKYSPSFPINRALLEENINLLEKGSIFWGESEGVELPAPTRQEKAEILSLLESANMPTDTDSLFKDLVIGQLDAYLKGEQTLEQAVEQAMKKVKLYLAE